MKMNKKLVISVVILTVFASLLWARWRPAQRFDATAEVGHSYTSTLRVVTWNVGYFALASNKNMRAPDIDAVSELLKSTAAQVVMLQELGTVEQANQIAGNLGENWRVYSVPTGHGEQVVAVLSPLSVVFEEDVVCGGRGVKGLTVRSASGQQVYVLGVHSPHPARGMAATVDSVSCAIAHARARDEGIRLVGGDMNYNFDEGNSNALYADITADFGDGTLAIGETYYAHTRIDHIFHYPKTLEVVTEESGMVDVGLRFADVPGFRDHRPIVVSYRLD